ncbi:sulfur oxidation c-type cytochrome SoxA [Ancylobacter oerskovii]|uniref:SoxAX cytochrome complex subunit A n=1 Tax=Ancylobacter oerskovii TaxID=459519 RepID=A0ABW4Z4W3_9HYPH|nr:sulfur oxidation c-type cytochrome SoxA [Ancylobacter oerskovii]MBS7542515.1 sulfur oxidation c-type cytochrome SoxA [Ancylobacter oerskovii]
MRFPLAFAAAQLCAGIAVAQEIPPSERRSGTNFMSAETQAIQADDGSNPGMLWVLQGGSLWDEPAGASRRSCASCHGEAATSMRGVAARYPAFDAASGASIDLAGKIDQCRMTRQHATSLPRESEELLGLTAYVGHQSRGMPIAPPDDARLDAARAEGKRLFQTRMGQLDLSCSSCHDANWRGRLGGSAVTQAHPTGYPIYRLEWQTIGSLQRRMRGCMVGVRAEPFAYGSAEFVALELYLAERAAGLAIETPAVRP